MAEGIGRGPRDAVWKGLSPLFDTDRAVREPWAEECRWPLKAGREDLRVQDSREMDRPLGHPEKNTANTLILAQGDPVRLLTSKTT